MSGKASIKHLLNAKIGKNDEFYTQMTDIEKELVHYQKYFSRKTVLCNCDDPKTSNFFHYFALNFFKFDLKELITSCYRNQDINLFSRHESEQAAYLAYKGANKNNRPDIKGIKVHYLKGDGDFRSDECIDLLKQADLVITNPPFSLFREYVSQLIEHNKKFIIIGNQNALTYKEIFKLIKNNKIWMGRSIHSGDREFGVPQNYPLKAANSRIDENGNKYIRVKGVRWFTNLDYKERHEDLILYKKYTGNETEYPKYDNYEAINVDKTKDIPIDYSDAIGVPITFIDKYNPEQFEIIALGIVGSIDFACNKKMEILDENGNTTGKFTFNGKGTLYRSYNPKTDKKSPAFKDCNTGELYSSIYARIIVKNKRL